MGTGLEFFPFYRYHCSLTKLVRLENWTKNLRTGWESLNWTENMTFQKNLLFHVFNGLWRHRFPQKIEGDSFHDLLHSCKEFYSFCLLFEAGNREEYTWDTVSKPFDRLKMNVSGTARAWDLVNAVVNALMTEMMVMDYSSDLKGRKLLQIGSVKHKFT